MHGNLVAQTVGSRHAEPDFLRLVIGAASGLADARICLLTELRLLFPQFR